MARGGWRKPGRSSRRDENHVEISDAFRGAGIAVMDLSGVGGGVPDLLVSAFGVLHLVEIKNPANAYGRRGLSKRQAKWAEAWRGGPVNVVRSVSDVKVLLDAWVKGRECVELNGITPRPPRMVSGVRAGGKCSESEVKP